MNQKTISADVGGLLGRTLWCGLLCVGLWTGLCSATASAADSSVAARTAAAARPNLVFIIADDCTHRDWGCYGGQALTPRLDQLARESMRFTQCFQAAPMCSPTRHCIYTGQYPVKTGAYPNHTFAREGTRSIAHHLQPLGYRVHLSGKTHVQPKTVFPFEYSGTNNPDPSAIGKLLAECKSSQTPFCLIACSNEPHTPWNNGDPEQYDAARIQLPAYFVDTPQTRESMQKYLAEITYFDGQVGEILDLLTAHDLAQDTLVMVVSEQGSSFPFGKWTLYDTGIQSACLVRWPGKVAPGSVSDALVEYVDVTPTFVAAAGGTASPDFDGRSFLPLLLGETTTHKTHVFSEMTTRGINNGSDYFGIRAVRSAQFKYIWNFTPEATFQNACTSSPEFKSWMALAAQGDQDAAEKVRRYTHRPAEELYDVTKDPTEWTNLADDPAYAHVKAQLRSELEAWMAAQGDLGQATEMEALKHLAKGREDAESAPQSRPKGKRKLRTEQPAE